MKKSILYIALCLAMCASCSRPLKMVRAEGNVIMIDSTLDAIQDSSYLAYLAPIKADLEANLGAPIGYAPRDLEVHQPECSMLNWASDALYEMAKQLYPEQVDMAVVNIGGMRCNWGAGDITFRHVFELMPFDNELVVLTLQGKEILALCELFAAYGGQGVAGLRIKARNGKLLSATIDGKEIVPTAHYTVATSDYLSQGNDGLTQLKNHVELWRSEQKIRDLYIAYVQQVKTVAAEVDGRMDL
jgi:2',3'-cyclic-nucleotide 2'-phosphodiesterase (5'-nucleotidase family)